LLIYSLLKQSYCFCYFSFVFYLRFFVLNSFSIFFGRKQLMSSTGSLGHVLLCGQLLRLIGWLLGVHLWWRFEERLQSPLEIVFGRSGSFVGRQILPLKLVR
jgi:hypothetical protein